ncbi:hypothetical protein RTM1035_13273 [Roseovarius sp. TM1035]|nr:hypothetical protein RTM1035_13273 [Roseovarius sp. TM1035]
MDVPFFVWGGGFACDTEWAQHNQ